LESHQTVSQLQCVVSICLQVVKMLMQDLHKMQIENDQNNTPVQWNTAVKFLMARKFDARRARELYRSHEVCTKV